jgi:hypothetical protein
MESNQPYSGTRTGTIGGTLLVVLIQINFQELLKTAILAAIGASVSFLVTVGWNWLIGKVKEKKRS